MKNLVKKINFKFLVFGGLVLLPVLVFAADPITFDSLVSGTFLRILNSVIVLIFAIALVIFIWGVVQYVINQEDSAEREKGRSFMIWGIIALFIMVSVYGLVNLLKSTIVLDNTAVNPPQIKLK